jgi:hypothetical protein
MKYNDLKKMTRNSDPDRGKFTGTCGKKIHRRPGYLWICGSSLEGIEAKILWFEIDLFNLSMK